MKTEHSLKCVHRKLVVINLRNICFKVKLDFLTVETQLKNVHKIIIAYLYF